jgi:sugar lactone lactonase YvrE
VENQGQEEDMVQPIPGFRFNDGKCDPKGRFLVGNMNKDWRDPEARKGKLFKMVEPPELRHEDNLDGMLHQYGPNAVLKVW